MKKKILLMALAAILVMSLFACGDKTPDGSQVTPKPGVKQLTMVVTEQTIADLESYPDLEQADLSGSTCYAAIVDYIARHPEVKVIYTVDLGGSVIRSDATTVRLEAGAYDPAKLVENLVYLPKVTALELPDTTLSGDQMAALKEKYPAVTIDYTILINGKEVELTAAEVDLSGMQMSEVAAYSTKLSLLENLQTVELMSADGTSRLSMADVKELQQGAPNVTFHYSFKLGGKTISTTDERIIYTGETLDGLGGEQALRNALDILSGCTYFRLDNTYDSINNETMASIRADYPNIKVVWRIHHDAINTYNVPDRYMQKDSLLTDTEVLRAVYGVTDKNSDVFKYFIDVKYLDMGHDTEMSDISFLGYMPKLEIAILSGSPIVDLSPLANCKKLEFLEIAWCGHVKDISPLAQCDSLKYLNLAHTRVKDLSPLAGLDMQMISYVNSGNRVGFTEASWAEIAQMFPDCWLTYNPLHDNNASPYGVGWRYVEGGGYTPIYRKVRDVFGLDYMG